MCLFYGPPLFDDDCICGRRGIFGKYSLKSEKKMLAAREMEEKQKIKSDKDLADAINDKDIDDYITGLSSKGDEQR